MATHQMDWASTLLPYQQIAAAIRIRIEQGDLLPGERVHSADDLMGIWGVSYDTARKALQLLKTWGLTYSRLGYGTYVRNREQDGA